MENNVKGENGNLKSLIVISRTSLIVLKLIIFTCLSLNFSCVSAHLHAKIKVIAMTQLVQHPSLDQARAGILDELKINGFEIGKNIKLIEQNAQGSVTNAVSIAKNFASLDLSAVVAISTTSAQTVLAAFRDNDTPIIFSSVTDPKSAGLVQDIDIANDKITGSADFPQIDDEVKLIHALTPKAKTIGLLYNSGEANSTRIVELFKEAAAGRWNFVEVTVASSAESIAGLNSLVGRVDAVYIPSDNTVFSAIPKLVQISRKNKLPIYSNDPDSVVQGFMACAGYTQYSVGRLAGKLLVKTLRGEKSLKIEKPKNSQIYVNEITAKKIGLATPANIDGIELKIVKEK